MTLTYKDAGVDINKQDEFIQSIKKSVRSTYGPEVIGGIGGFSGLFRMDMDKYSDPVLVSSTDGVGTKLKIAFMADHHKGVGIDLVAMVVNDLIVCGAQPLFFLDYFATGALDLARAQDIVSGIAEGCRQAGCSLIGGETAEMPGFYSANEYDLAGFGVGVVDSDNMINGSGMAKGDVLIGLKSSGLHSNGYSLARKVLLEKMKIGIDDYVEDLGKSLGEEILTPTRIYVKSVLNVLKYYKVKAIAHITGGGLIDNLPRILPKRLSCVIERDSWEMPPIFGLIQDMGKIDDREMCRTFNMGIGMVLIVPKAQTEDVLLQLKGLKEPAVKIGYVDTRKDKDSPVVFVE
ncbi:MAG: phosphoribosylformylglycinamidine cyclo-ligase [Thermodesulfobacteriota bacterium]|nr:phosphoribosylformylglycinamidine cyclo-ligase [Thermodesulfobacteriota bacterium]